MEDDEEINSQPSAGSGSPASPRPNGRITVTVAAAPPQNTLTLALPIQQPRTGNGGGGGGGGGREDCWSEGATAVLIEAWGERYLELSRGNLKQKHWKEVADIVSSREDFTKTPKTDIQCKNRIDTVKKKYKLEKAKIVSGSGPSKWPFFERLEQLIGPSAKIVSSGGAGAGPSSVTPALRVPVGIPVGVRSAQFQKQQLLQQKQKQQQLQLRRRPQVDSDSSHSERGNSPDSTDSFPPETYERKRPRVQLNPSAMPARQGGYQRREDGGAAGGGEREKNWGNSVRELTRAILKFGEAYEQAESSKLQQLVDMEKQRMKFAKELELQRMQFFMKTQLELSQLKHRRVRSSNHNGNNNHSDSSN